MDRESGSSRQGDAPAAEPAPLLRPPSFGGEAADGRRWEFDFKNGVLVTNRTPIDAVFIGDSITHFWELNAYFRRFGLVVNRGIAGDKAHILARRFEADALQLRPRACVLLVGVNNTWGPGTPEEIPALVADSHRRMLAMARERNIPLLVGSLLPVGEGCEDYPRRNLLIRRINGRLRELCAESGAPYVDYHAAFAGPDGLTMREGLSDDGIHPHVIGYNRMAEVLTPFLQAALPG